MTARPETAATDTPLTDLDPVPAPALRELPGLYLELAKARLSALVLVTTVVGYLAAVRGPLDWWALGAVALGTYLCAAGANGLNQWWEQDRDARMTRTCERPLPSHRISRPHALAASLLMALAGTVVLLLGNNPLTAALGFANVAIYVLAYTPLKPLSAMNTLVGAICGAIPPLMGWAAATGTIGVGGWVLGALLFVWQIPHSLALAYLYREDYERGGYRMLPLVDGGARLTFHMINLYCLALLPISLAATLLGVAGWIYGAGALLLGGWMTVLGIRLWRRQGAAEARRLFIASIVYLPVLLALLVIDRGGWS